MTREETIKILNDEEIASLVGRFHGGKESLDLAIAALRPVSREQVENAYSDCSECSTCKLCIWNETKRCNNCHSMSLFKPLSNFCPKCGKPLTDEALEMEMERLEALKDGL